MSILRPNEGVQHRRAMIDELDQEERIISMRAIPYNVETRLAPGLVESFAPGAFKAAMKDQKRYHLWMGHSDVGGHLTGRTETVEDRDDGLWLETRVSATPAGDELLTLVRDGVLQEASIEFAPLADWYTQTQRGADVVWRHKRAKFLGVAMVPRGAYGREAMVASVRDVREQARESAVAHLRSLCG